MIARELGFPSWTQLRTRVEELTLDFDSAVSQFIDAATEGRADRAARLLALHPRLAHASFHTALLLGDAATVEERLAERPELATEAGGPRGWPPLLYLCHTAPRIGPSGQAEGIVAIARRLLALGADPNARFPWLHHGVRRPALWGAVCFTRLLPLAAVLLDAGADPSDGVTLPLAAGGGDIDALELLHAHGADVNRPWATDGASPLYLILSWADTVDGVRWLLAHGADPDPVFAPNGESPLHVVARRWTAEVAAWLVARGADVDRRRADGRTPHALAELNGNREVAEWLLAHGASGELSDVDRLVAACSRGDRATAEAMLAARPSLRAGIGGEHYEALYHAAERGDTRAIDAMLACGFDANRGDEEIGKTALHVAAQAGQVDAVRALLAHGASVSVRDREFHGQPLVWAADGQRMHGGDGRDFAAVGRLLIEAGSPVEWQAGEEPSEEIVDIIGEWRRAAQVAS